MRTRTITLVEFDSMEFQMLQRVEPSIRIGFPTDRIDQARLLAERLPSAVHRGAIKTAQQQWEGRWLKQICTTKQEWDAKAIHGAWDAAITLEAVLEAESDRAHWERVLIAPKPETRDHVALRARQDKAAGGVGLVAPGTDVCGMLAETRGAQLRDLRNALPILEAARNAVGPVPEHMPMKYEGV